MSARQNLTNTRSNHFKTNHDVYMVSNEFERKPSYFYCAINDTSSRPFTLLIVLKKLRKNIY